MSAKRNEVRIIGGEYRSRRITFADREGLRPTADRIRETLFNWLQPHIVGAFCIDLYAGSGALGIEALSRGASGVEFVERDKEVAAQLSKNLAALQNEHGIVYHDSAQHWLTQRLASNGKPADLVFIDPPFAQSVLYSSAALLMEHAVLAERALVYLEDGRPIDEARLPSAWKVLNHKRAGDVHYCLCQHC